MATVRDASKVEVGWGPAFPRPMSSLFLQGRLGMRQMSYCTLYHAKSIKWPLVTQNMWLGPVIKCKVCFWDQMGQTELENESSSLSLSLSEHNLLLLFNVMFLQGRRRHTPSLN